MPPPKQSDPQFKLRLPPELKDAIEASADSNKRSINSEIIDRLTHSFDSAPMLSEIGLTAMSKRFEATAEALEELLFDVRDLDIDAFVASRPQKKPLSRREAIRLIVRLYCTEHGYLTNTDAAKDLEKRPETFPESFGKWLATIDREVDTEKWPAMLIDINERLSTYAPNLRLTLDSSAGKLVLGAGERKLIDRKIGRNAQRSPSPAAKARAK